MKAKREMLNPLDRAIMWAAPRWGARRALARAQLRAVKAFYDGATLGRRGASIRRSIADANTVTQRSLPRLRSGSRDLARNNPHAKRAVEAIVGNVIGTGISPQFMRRDVRADDIEALAKLHLETTECDADHRHTYRGLQSIGFQSVIEGGDVLVRRRWRRMSDGLAVPVQFQLLEAEYLDESKDGPVRGGGRIIQGVEYDAIGRIRQFWLFREHPGSLRPSTQSEPVPARDIAHMLRTDRPGQVRGIPWLAPVMLALADFADFQDAQLQRQKIAACFAAFITEAFDGGGIPNSVTENDDGELIDAIEPGMLERLPPGTDVKFGNPPGVEGYSDYTRELLHTMAAGVGISYQALTGDLRQANFANGRMGHIEFQRNIDRWREMIVIPQFCRKLEGWWLEAVALTGIDVSGVTVRHVPPRREIMDPTKEGRADKDMIRSGQKTLSQVIRASGRDPVEHLTEYAEDMKLLDKLGLKLDSDARNSQTPGGNDDPHDDAEGDDGERRAA